MKFPYNDNGPVPAVGSQVTPIDARAFTSQEADLQRGFPLRTRDMQHDDEYISPET